MAYNTKPIVTDKDGNPISQYYNPETDQYEPVEGANGANKVLVMNNDLSLIPILEKLDQLVGTVVDSSATLNLAKEYTDNELTKHKLDYASQRQQDQLKLAKVEKDINDYKQVMSQVNVNQEATQKASGYGIISLPKNAANGQISATVAGRTYTNIFGDDGDFEEFVSGSPKGWNISYVTVEQVESFDGGRALKTRGRDSVSEVTKVLNVQPNKKHLFAVWARRTDDAPQGSTNIIVYDGPDKTYPILFFKTVPKNTAWELFVSTFTPTTSTCAVRISISGGKGTREIQTDKFCAIAIENEDYDLSDVDLLKKYPYVNGTKSTVSAIRLKSVGKNLINAKEIKKRNNYILNDYGIEISDPEGYTLNKWAVKSNTQYKIKGYGIRRIYYFDNNGNLISRSDALGTIQTGVEEYTFTTPLNCSFISFQYAYNLKDGDPTLVDWYLQEAAYPYEPYTESTQYLPNVGELRSLPNGVKDEIRVSGGKAELIKRINNQVLNGTEAWEYFTYDATYDLYRFFIRNWKSDNKSVSFNQATNNALVSNSNGDVVISSDLNSMNWRGGRIAINSYEGYPHLALNIKAEVGVTNLISLRTYLQANPITLIYQLAEPEIIPINVSGTLLSNPSGTVYVENVVADAGIYTDKMEVLYSDLPIKALEKISKVDFATGLEIELDVSDAVIAEDKLSFTHPDLVDGDIVFFTYEYDRESTEGETEIEYYDSRYVIKDSVTGKFYKWHIAVADGVPSIELTEV